MKEKNVENKESLEMSLNQKISYGLLFLAILYVLWIVIKLEFLGKQVQIVEIYIAGLLSIIGILLGGFLERILQHYIKKYMVEYGFDEKIKNVVKAETSLIKEKVEFVELQIENENQENSQNFKDEVKGDFDTVIVNVKNSINDVKNNLEYICPSHYSFKNGLKYIAFNESRRIVGYGRLNNPEEYNEPHENIKVFKIDEFIPLNIPHEKKGPFIQNKMYCVYSKLINAKNTDEIRNFQTVVVYSVTVFLYGF